jgi:hypothetical protein
MLVLQSEAKLQSVSERLHERVSNHLTKLCSLAPDHPLQRCISWFPLQGSVFPSPLRAVYEKYEAQLEPETGLRISERPSWVMPPWQALQTVRRASVVAAMRQCYMCCCAAVCMLKLAKRCGKQQEIGGVTLHTCWEGGAVVRMQGRASSWMAHAKVGGRI